MSRRPTLLTCLSDMEVRFPFTLSPSDTQLIYSVRKCPGEALATLEMRTILAMLLQNFDFELEGEITLVTQTVTTKPDGKSNLMYHRNQLLFLFNGCFRAVYKSLDASD